MPRRHDRHRGAGCHRVDPGRSLAGHRGGVLVDRNRRFLTGEPASSKIYTAAARRLADIPDVARVRFLRLEFIGPKQLFLVGSVNVIGDDPESHVAHRLRRIERELERDPLIADALLTISDPDFEDR